MYNIRIAEEADAKQCVLLGYKFFEASPYKGVVESDLPSMLDLFYKLLKEGYMVVGELAGEIVGIISVNLYPFIANNSVVIASEVVWWVEPEHRNTSLGAKLIKRAEQEATERGAHIMSMSLLSNSPPGLDEAYKKMGYVEQERSFIRSVV